MHLISVSEPLEQHSVLVWKSKLDLTRTYVWMDNTPSRTLSYITINILLTNETLHFHPATSSQNTHRTRVDMSSACLGCVVCQRACMCPSQQCLQGPKWILLELRCQPWLHSTCFIPVISACCWSPLFPAPGISTVAAGQHVSVCVSLHFDSAGQVFQI